MTKKLVELDIQETSGVDHPAHLEEGWMVAKAAGVDVAAEVERILKEAEEMHKQHGVLLGALESAVSYLDAAPDVVKAAANTLHEYLTGADMEHEPESPAEDAGDTEKEAGVDDESRHSLAGLIVDGLKGLFSKSVEDTNEEVTEVADEKNEAVEAKTDEVTKAAAEATDTSAAEATDEATEDKADEAKPEAAPEEAPAGDVAAAIQAEFMTALSKAVEDIKADTKAEVEKVTEELEGTREALSKALDRVAKLEGGTARSTQPKGQDGDLEKSEKQSVFTGAFRARMGIAS